MATKPSVLLIDDDETFTAMARTALEAAGYDVAIAGNGIEGICMLLEREPDLVILDVVMPQLDGWETCERIRQASDVPIIMLTGVSGSSNELKGLDGGADMYMTKPLDLLLLIARVNALMRRSRRGATHSGVRPITIGNLQIDPAGQVATRHGQPLRLSRTEFRLLVTLASNPGRVIPSKELIRRVWGDSEVGDQEQYLKLYIYYLRREIEDDPAQPQYIRNRRGIGYMLTCPNVLDS